MNKRVSIISVISWFAYITSQPGRDSIQMMLLASLILGVATGAFVTFAFPRLWRKLNPSKGGRITLTALGAITGIFVLVLIRGILLSDYRTLGLTREDWHIMMFLGTLVAMPFFWYFATKKVIPWIEGTITL